MKVRDIFTINDVAQKCFLEAGDGGLDNEIECINIMEVPDGVYWVSKNDFIISTGYAVNRGDTSLDYIIKMLIKKNAAGLGLKKGRYIDEISKDVIDLCNKNNFPLIRIDSILSYNEIILPLNEFLKDEQKNLEQLLIDGLEKINEHTDAGDYLYSILNKFFGRKFIFLNDNYFNYFFNPDYREIFDIIKKNYVSIQNSSGFYSLFENNKFIDILKIESSKREPWFLCAISEKENRLSQKEKSLIVNSSYLISLYLNEDFLSTLEPLYEYPEIISDLLKNKVEKEDFQNMISMSGIDKNLKRKVLAISANFVSDNEKKFFLYKIKSILEGTKDVYCYFNDYYFILIANDNFNFENLYFIINKFDVHIGVSRKCENIFYLNLAFDEAVFAANIGRYLNPDSNIHNYEDFIMYHLVFQLRNHPALLNSYKNTIVRICDYDEKNDTELLKTIDMLIKKDFKISESAKALYVHRTTMYKRIERINEITDMNLSDNSKVIILMCYKLYELLNINNSCD